MPHHRHHRQPRLQVRISASAAGGRGGGALRLLQALSGKPVELEPELPRCELSRVQRHDSADIRGCGGSVPSQLSLSQRGKMEGVADDRKGPSTHATDSSGRCGQSRARRKQGGADTPGDEGKWAHSSELSNVLPSDARTASSFFVVTWWGSFPMRRQAAGARSTPVGGAWRGYRQERRRGGLGATRPGAVGRARGLSPLQARPPPWQAVLRRPAASSRTSTASPARPLQPLSSQQRLSSPRTRLNPPSSSFRSCPYAVGWPRPRPHRPYPPRLGLWRRFGSRS